MLHLSHKLRWLAALAALVVAGCAAIAVLAGGGSDDAGQLLRESFAADHVVTSGRLALEVLAIPSAAQGTGAPATLGLQGPFERRASGQLAASEFRLSVSARGTHASVLMRMTPTAAYLMFGDTGYRLPATDFARLQSAFAGVATPPTAGPAGPSSPALGIHPLRWAVSPTIVGTEAIDGVPTIHIRAGVDVSVLVGDLSPVLASAGSLAGNPGGDGAAAAPALTAAHQRPTLDVWTGKQDKTVRRLVLDVPLAPAEQRGAATALTLLLRMQYSDLNRPQAIGPPTDVAALGQLRATGSPALAQVEAALGDSSG